MNLRFNAIHTNEIISTQKWNYENHWKQVLVYTKIKEKHWNKHCYRQNESLYKSHFFENVVKYWNQ